MLFSSFFFFFLEYLDLYLPLISPMEADGEGGGRASGRSMDHPDCLIPLAPKVVQIMNSIMKIYTTSKTHTLRVSDSLSLLRFCPLSWGRQPEKAPGGGDIAASDPPTHSAAIILMTLPLLLHLLLIPALPQLWRLSSVGLFSQTPISAALVTSSTAEMAPHSFLSKGPHTHTHRALQGKADRAGERA